jgi:uncharacterized protein (DUF2236 family)
MNPRSPDDHLAPVSEGALERRLEGARAAAAGEIEGLYGPGSITWRVDREAAIFLGAGRALLLQLAHPWVGAAIAEHSRVSADPIGRFHRTFGTVFTMVFGTLHQALTTARRLHRRHAGITGALPAEAGPFADGSRYVANHIPALQWVHATLVDTALRAHDLVLPPLTEDEREQYWREAKLFGALFGIPPEALPGDWKGFAAYTDAMMDSDALKVSSAAQEIGRSLLFGANQRWRPPVWYQAVTAQMLPERLRAEFGLNFGERDYAVAMRAVARIRQVCPLLPQRLRFVGPYQEAMARLAGRPAPDFVTRRVNAFWIGRQSMSA